MDEEKAVKYVKQFSIAYIVIFILILLLNKGKGIIIDIIGIALLILCYIGADKRKIYGPICGIIVSIILILSRDTVSILLAIFLLINCINLIKYLK